MVPEIIAYPPLSVFWRLQKPEISYKCAKLHIFSKIRGMSWKKRYVLSFPKLCVVVTMSLVKDAENGISAIFWGMDCEKMRRGENHAKIFVICDDRASIH